MVHLQQGSFGLRAIYPRRSLTMMRSCE